MNKQRARAYLFICTTVIFWGISFFWTSKLLKAQIPIFFLIFTRITLAALILFVAGRVFGLIEKLKKKTDLLWFFGLALMEPFFYFVGENYGLKFTDSPSLTSVIISSIPIFGLIAGVTFYKEKVNTLNILGIFLTVPGLLLVVFGKWGFQLTNGADGTGTNMPLGIAFLFMSVVAAVGHTVIIKRMTMHYNAFTVTFYQHAIGALYFILPMLLYDVPKMDVPAVLTDWNFWYPILMLAVFCSSIAFFLFTLAVKELGITRTNTFTAIIPIITAAVGVILGLENIVWLQASGIFVVVGGVILSQLPSRNSSRSKRS
jgi:drug/metabolite transporter (DMT)-like permease